MSATAFVAPDPNLEVIQEEKCSPAMSTVMGDKDKSKLAVKSEALMAKSRKSIREPDIVKTSNILQDTCPCTDDVWGRLMEEKNAKAIDPEVIENILSEKEAQLREEFHETLTKEIAHLKEKFDYILHNEQVRASYMLREAYRERQEKIKALQSQLECKNMAGLMYVMCTERRKSRLEKMKLIEQYTTYINCLHDILTDGQETILKLSRGYKTAARLDLEWKEKMKSIIGEFQKFVEHYLGGTIESSQYFFDVPRLIQSEAPKKDNPNEDPIDEPQYIEELKPEKTWWEQLDGDCRPFVMFGDMADFEAPTRRETLKHIKALKTAPKRWKEYAFHDMYIQSGCKNANTIKDIYFQRLPSQTRWECQGVQTDAISNFTIDTCSRRVTTASLDIRGGGTMGSILKLITGSGINQAPPEAKATLLGARDSMEIMSTTRLRDSEEKKTCKSIENSRPGSQTCVKLPIGRRRTSFFEERRYFEESNIQQVSAAESTALNEVKEKSSNIIEDESTSNAALAAKVGRHDSLEVVTRHVPNKDKMVADSRVCPMEQCRRMRMDSFVHSLPSYMKVRPFTHIEQSYEGYQACSPEQLEILLERIQAKKALEKKAKDNTIPIDPLGEWTEKIHGVATQTSNTSMSDLPECTCRESVTEASEQGKIFNLLDLLPAKLKFDEIANDCLYNDSHIEFNRFKVVGEESNASMKPEPIYEPKDFTSKRLYMIRNILKENPSLCSLFQANAKC